MYTKTVKTNQKTLGSVNLKEETHFTVCTCMKDVNKLIKRPHLSVGENRSNNRTQVLVLVNFTQHCIKVVCRIFRKTTSSK